MSSSNKITFPVAAYTIALCCHCCPNIIMFYYRAWSCIHINSPSPPRVCCVAAQWYMRRAGTIHHLNQAETTAKTTFWCCEEKQKLTNLTWFTSLGGLLLRYADVYETQFPSIWTISSLTGQSQPIRCRAWVVANRLKAEVSVWGCRGQRRRMAGAATCTTDEWWAICETAVCVYLFLLAVLFLNESIFLSFRQNRHGFIGKQDGASRHIVHLPPVYGWWMGLHGN